MIYMMYGDWHYKIVMFCKIKTATDKRICCIIKKNSKGDYQWNYSEYRTSKNTTAADQA